MFCIYHQLFWITTKTQKKLHHMRNFKTMKNHRFINYHLFFVVLLLEKTDFWGNPFQVRTCKLGPLWCRCLAIVGKFRNFVASHIQHTEGQLCPGKDKKKKIEEFMNMPPASLKQVPKTSKTKCLRKWQLIICNLRAKRWKDESNGSWKTKPKGTKVT